MHSPSFDERHVDGAPCSAGAHVERSRRPQQGDAVGRVVSVQRRLLEERLHFIRQLELLLVIRQWLRALQNMLDMNSANCTFINKKILSTFGV